MKRVFNVVLLLLILTACNSPISTAWESDDSTAAPYFPDTPSPEELNALRVDAPAFIRLDMLNELEGWAVTEAEIVRTNDGGLTWYNVTPPGMDETGFGVDTFILDTNHAWLQKPDFDNFPTSGFQYRTTDGGLTWTEIIVPFSRGDIHFVDPENGWAMADLGVGAGSNAVAVYRTETGGTVWEQVYTNDPNDPQAGDSLPLGGLKSDIVPLDIDTAWVTGVIYAPGEIYLHRTDDGGQTWTPVALELPPGAESLELGIDEDQMKFVSDSAGFLALRMAGEAVRTAIYRSEDGGDTWSLMPAVIEGTGASAFLSEQDAILYDGELFHVTRDGARSWSTVLPDILFDESFVDMEFVHLLAGWVVTMDPSNLKSLYRTHDGGATWLPVLP